MEGGLSHCAKDFARGGAICECQPWCPKLPSGGTPNRPSFLKLNPPRHWPVSDPNSDSSLPGLAPGQQPVASSNWCNCNDANLCVLTKGAAVCTDRASCGFRQRLAQHPAACFLLPGTTQGQGSVPSMPRQIPITDKPSSGRVAAYYLPQRGALGSLDDKWFS